MQPNRPPPHRPPLLSRIRDTIPTPLAFALLAIAIIFLYKNSPSSVNGYTYDWDSEGWYLSPSTLESTPFHHSTSYQLGYGGNTLDCPESGGIWSYDLSPHELKTLGIHRSQDDEDEKGYLDQPEREGTGVCIHIHNLTYAASQPRKWSQWSNELVRFEDYFRGDIEVVFQVCFPQDGGVWLLMLRRYKDGFADVGLRKAGSMEERCRVLRKKGGVFCRSLQDGDCKVLEVLRPGLEGGDVEFRGWEEYGRYKVLLIEQYG